MKIIELEELKEIELEMVKYFDKICRENNINYYMVGGTLLGAVRHKGFIPWDDDIDIAMPRKEFEKFCRVMECENSYYELDFYNISKQYGYPSPKLLDKRTTLIDYKLGSGKEVSSVFLDIFLYDGMGNSKSTAMFHYLFLKIFKRMVFLSRRNFHMESKVKTIVFAIPWLICKLLGTNRINRLYNKFCSRREFEEYKYVACAAGRYGKREVFEQSVFNKTCDLPFEDTVLKAPIGWDEYLKSLYGDYMKLPPKEAQQSNHSVEVWWNENNIDRRGN